MLIAAAGLVLALGETVPASAAPVEAKVIRHTTVRACSFWPEPDTNGVVNWISICASALQQTELENGELTVIDERGILARRWPCSPGTCAPEELFGYTLTPEELEDGAVDGTVTVDAERPGCQIAMTWTPNLPKTVTDLASLLSSPHLPIEVVPDPVSVDAGEFSGYSMPGSATGSACGLTPSDSEETWIDRFRWQNARVSAETQL